MRDHYRNLEMQKSVGSDGMHPRVLRQLADVVAEPFSIMFQSCYSEC